MSEIRCPDCGARMGAGYTIGETCIECHSFGDAADQVIDYLNGVSAAMTVVGSDQKVELRDGIKSILRDQFS